MELLLGIESTCDETAAAVVADGVSALSNVVATQVELHAKYRGVVPEIASRAHIENILPVMREAIEKAEVTLDDVDAIAVAHRPGLIGSLLIGVTAAKTLAWALGKPLVGVDHVHAHLYSVMLSPEGSGAGDPGSERKAPPDVRLPAVGLVVSGGHTALYHVRDWLDVELIGSTIDDAVGEAYDKVASILGLGYPGGPVMDRLAATGNPKAIEFPRTMLGRDSLDFSFSGLKTAVLYHVKGVPTKNRPLAQSKVELGDQQIADIAASFQAACVDVIVKKLKRALVRTKAKSAIVGGGVSANRGLRDALKKFPVPVHFPELTYCTDNAAMAAGLGHLYFAAGRFSPLDLDAITHSQFRD
jgi:N6-L-threonylcarbamoyladenine synthase